jgi:opacity protein-like surface antigen
MKKLLFASVAAATLIATNAASAADMGLPVKGRALEPEWNWSGFYAGLNVGYARGNTVWNDLDGFENAGGVLANESTNGFSAAVKSVTIGNFATQWSASKPTSTISH